jgi:NAD(P)H-dependent FMN reductase
MTHARGKILVISASTRPGRICPTVARWVIDQAPTGELDLELVDLADWPLPGDEPDVPAVASAYANEHTRDWSRKIGGAAGFVFVTPQYNWGYPASLKNALDHLYHEWRGKPAVIVSYGFHGGGRCAAQLRQVLEGFRMRPAATMPALTLPEAMRTGAGVEAALPAFAPSIPDVERAFTELQALLEEAVPARAG